MPIPHVTIPNIPEHRITKFWGQVSKDQKSKCWEWFGYIQSNGYGSMSIRCQQFLAHRISYYLNNPNFDQSLQVLHKCDNRVCVNPNHLFLGTALDNMRDMIKKNRQFKGRSEQMRGSLGIYARSKIPRKLDPDKVREIRNNPDKTWPSRVKMAAKYKVHVSTISCVISRLKWKHVTP